MNSLVCWPNAAASEATNMRSLPMPWGEMGEKGDGDGDGDGDDDGGGDGGGDDDGGDGDGDGDGDGNLSYDEERAALLGSYDLVRCFSTDDRQTPSTFQP